MDADLKLYLDELKREVLAQVASADGRSQVRLEELESRMQLRMEESEARMRAHTEEVETRLLTEFWKWAKSSEARYRQTIATVVGMDERVRLIEERLTDLESRRPS